VNDTGWPVKRRFLLLSLAILVLDQWTKWIIERTIPLHDSWEIVPGVFYLSHVRNSGIAFGLMPAHGELWREILLVAVACAAIGLVARLFVTAAPGERRFLLALSLVAGGATGNLLDRVTTGAVTDFLAVYLGSYRWPDFNVADSALVCGIGLFLLDAFWPRRRSVPAPG